MDAPTAPPPATVMTVLGRVAADELGVVDAHDHVLIRSSWGTVREPDLLLDDETDAADELEAYRAAGGTTIVDAMPTACGRDAPGLARLAERTGVRIVATAGYHLSDYYPPWHWYHRLDVDGLAAVIRAEVTDGFDAGEHDDPEVRRTGIRPGLLKAAYGFHRALPAERRALRAVAEVHRETGLPLMVHVEHGADPDAPLDDLEAAGVSLDRVVLAHLDRTADPALHARVLDRGAWLGYDGLYRERARPASAVLDLVRAAGPRADRILLGGDVARRSLRRISGATGLAGYSGAWHTRVRAELGADLADQLFITNPARFLGVLSAEDHPTQERPS
jgi:phosphotriesterase-related protein